MIQIISSNRQGLHSCDLTSYLQINIEPYSFVGKSLPNLPATSLCKWNIYQPKAQMISYYT